jgi:hypothetical protein
VSGPTARPDRREEKRGERDMTRSGPWKPVVGLVVGSALLVGAYGAYQAHTVGAQTQTATPGVRPPSTSKLTVRIVAPANHARLMMPFNAWCELVDHKG